MPALCHVNSAAFQAVFLVYDIESLSLGAVIFSAFDKAIKFFGLMYDISVCFMEKHAQATHKVQW